MGRLENTNQKTPSSKLNMTVEYKKHKTSLTKDLEKDLDSIPLYLSSAQLHNR